MASDAFRTAARRLRRRPAVSLVTIVLASLGVAASTLVFSMVDASALRAPAVRAPGRLIELWRAADHSCAPQCTDALTPFQARAWPGALRSVQSAAVALRRDVAVRGVRGADAEPVLLAGAERGFFPTLGSHPLRGRLLSASDFTPGSPPVAIISFHLWTHLFGARTAVLGRAIETDAGTFTIVGIADGDFDYPHGTDVWVPVNALSAAPASSSRDDYVMVVRLRDGLPPAALASELARLPSGETTIAGRAARVAVATPFIPASRRASQGLWLAFAMIAIVFVTILVNLAVIFTVRSVGQFRELAVRAALGATTPRLLAPFLAEGAILATMAGSIGVWLATVGRGIAETIVANKFSVSLRLVMDWRVIAVALLGTAAVSATIALVPATLTLRSDVGDALRTTAHHASAGRGLRRMRDSTIVVQVTVSYLLVSTALLFVLSFLRTQQIDLGFDPHRVVVGAADMDTVHRADSTDRRSADREGVRALAALSRARGYAVWGETYPRARLLDVPERLHVEGRASLPYGQIPSTAFYVTPTFFRLFGIPAIRGRTLSAADSDGAVAIVSETAARMWWPRQDPIGRRLRLTEQAFETPLLTVVGVVPDRNMPDLALRIGLFPDIRLPYVYAPLELATFPRLRVVAPLVGRADRRIEQVEADVGAALPRGRVVVESDFYDRMLRRGGLDALLLNAKFLAASALAVVFATVLGVFASVSKMVASRTRELAVRLALGAPVPAAMLVVIRRTISLAVLGVVVGVGVMLATDQLLSRFLIGMRHPSALAFVGIGAGLVLPLVGASYVAARRIVQVDPAAALRME